MFEKSCWAVEDKLVGWVTYGHHSARAASSDENLARVAVVLLEGVGHHVGNRVAVAATVVGERLL